MPTSFSHRPARHWLQIDISVPAEFLEYVSHHLTRITGNGVQLITTGDQETVIGYLEKNDDYMGNRELLDAFTARLSSKIDKPLNLTMATIVEENWAENWKVNYKPSRITDNITVKPTWEAYTPGENEIVIEIDPGMAFGTGLHGSTRLALNFIDLLFSSAATRPKNVLDVGTGTAILAIAAAKLGAKKVMATDNDIDAVVVALENIEQNGETGHVLCADTDLADLEDSYDLVIANITADVLTELCPELVKKMTPNGHLILAGILHGSQADMVTHCFQAASLHLIAEKTEEEWISLLFSKKPTV